MASRLSHKDLQELKHDRFAEGISGSLEWAAANPGKVKIWGAAIVAALIAVGGYMYYSAQQADARAKALFDATFIADARVEGDGAPVGPNKVFPTQEERDAATQEAYQKVVDDYPGSQEAAIAELYLAAAAADRGDIDTAIKHYQNIADNSPEDYSAVARMSLAESLAGKGDMAGAEKQLQSIIDDPTTFVSAEEAQLTLGRLLGPTDPVRARKVLEELQQSRTVVSRQAIQEMAQLPPPPPTATENK